MKTILLATDYSANADHALQYALFLARKTGARLLLMHVYHYAARTGMYLSGEMIDTAQDKAQERARANMQPYINRIHEAYPDMQVSPVLKQGLPVEETLAYARQAKADLIIIGTRGNNADTEGFLGSVSAAIIENATCPVMTVPVSAAFKPIERVVYATNFEEKPSRIPFRLIQWTRQLKARLFVVHVSRRAEKDPEALKRFFQEELVHMEVFPEHVALEIIEDTDIVAGLSDFAAAQEADVLAMYTHKHSFWERLFGKRITHEALQEVELPLLIFHESAD